MNVHETTDVRLVANWRLRTAALVGTVGFLVAGCSATKAPRPPIHHDAPAAVEDTSEPAFEAPAAVVAKVSRRCEGDEASDGERCLTITRNDDAVECQYQIRRTGLDEQGREGHDVEVTTLTRFGDGSFQYHYESRDARRWSANGRQIETQGMLESRYSEDADGVGRCPGLNGGSVECEREDIMPQGADPCTSDFLG